MADFSSWLSNLTTSSHASEWISGLTGAAGAILGSIATIGWTAWYSHETRQRERREKFAAGAFAAYQRLNQIYSVSTVIRDHLDDGFAESKVREQPACTATMGMARMCGSVTFPIEELWTLTQVGGNELINRVNSLDHSFNNLLDSVDRYGFDRREVWSDMPTPDSMRGIIGSVGLTEEQYRRIAPGIASLDHTLLQLRPMAKAIVADTFEALTLLVHAKTRPLGKKFSVSLRNPEDVEVTIAAKDANRRSWWWHFLKS